MPAMGDVNNEETEHDKMVQTDTDIKRNSVIAGKPKPPLPKKPPIAVKPKVPAKSNSLERGTSCTSKTPPPLPKTPPKGPGGNVRSSPSPDRSCDIKPTNHLTESTTAPISSDDAQSTTTSTISYNSNQHVVQQNNHDDTCSFGSNDHIDEMARSKTLDRIPSEARGSQMLSTVSYNTLPKTPPKVSPKPSKRPPCVMPKPRLSTKLSEPDLLTIDLGHNNNTSESVTGKEEACSCGESPTTENSSIDNHSKVSELLPIENNQVKKSLDSHVQNGHSRPPPDLQYDSSPTQRSENHQLSNCENIRNSEERINTDVGKIGACDRISGIDNGELDKMAAKSSETRSTESEKLSENIQNDKNNSHEKSDETSFNASKKSFVSASTTKDDCVLSNSADNEQKELNQRNSESPVREQKSKSPIKERDLKSLARERKSNSPVIEIKSASPAIDRKSKSPVRERKSESPVKDRVSKSPVNVRKSESPVKEGISKSPFRERKSASPNKQNLASFTSTTATSNDKNNERKVVYEQLTVQSKEHMQSDTESRDNKSCDQNSNAINSHQSMSAKESSREVKSVSEQVESGNKFHKENMKINDDGKQNCDQNLNVPSPAPRKISPKPRPTPRKRLSISRGCDQPDVAEDYTDCQSAKSCTGSIDEPIKPALDNAEKCENSPIKEISIGSHDSMSSDHGASQILNESDANSSGSKSNSISDQSLCNISGIENIQRSKGQIVNNKLSASHNLLQADDTSQRRVDFSPMTEEALGETSSLLDEIEQIVSRRINALGGLSSEFSLKKAYSIETSTPVRPPRRKHKNRKTTLEEQFRDSCVSDTDSVVGDASFKGSTSSLNGLDDGDQSFKGSNTSLASVTSETGSRKPCPPKPPRKKLLKLNRSQSDVSASKYNAKHQEKDNQLSSQSEQEKYKKKVDNNALSLSKKGRSLTVDFKVPANQDGLLRELEIANRNKIKNDSSQIIKPRRKAPPPPPPVKVTEPNGAEHIRESEYHDIDHHHSRTSSAGEYVEIPEEFLENNVQPYCNETEVFQRSNKSPSPPELPPRNIGGATPVSSPQLSIKSFNPSIYVSTPKPGRERPVSDISQNSSLSSQESPLQDEMSSSDSDCEDEGERIIRKRAKKIFNIAKEIASSEHVFVDVLKLLNVDFRLHISRCTERAGRPVVPSEVLNRILKYLPQLQNFNEDLLRDLEDRVANWDKCQKVADIFVKKGPFLKMYTSYITDFEETNRVFDDALKKIPTFQHSVKEFEMLPRCASLGVRHYLLKPIQRIPQYKLLLQDYLKHLTPESEDYANTKIALTIVSEVADHANSSMRQGDQVQKMLEIQKSLDGHFEVIKPGRDLIKEGELMKLSRKEMQPRMFFLFNDVLLYTTPNPTGGYRLNNVLTLAGMKVTIPASEDYNNEFNIVTVQRSFTVEASSVQERDEWVKALSSAISDYTQRRNTFETVKATGQGSSAQELYESFYDKDFVLGSKAPIWIPDARVTMCMLCTCEFSVAWRRHHCRSCGRVVCSSCSDNKAPLEYLRNKPARVCNECFQKLHTDFEEKVNTGNVTEGMTQDTDGSFLTLSSLKERFQQIRRSARFTSKVKRPNRLVEVHANDLDCNMSGTLKVLKGKRWKKYWFLLKDKVLYKFKASEDVAAIDTMPVIGYDVERFKENHEGVAKNLVFQLKHKNQQPMVFQTENASSTERWIKAMEDAVKG